MARHLTPEEIERWTRAALGISWRDGLVPDTLRNPMPADNAGAACARCDEFNDYAQPNQPDGKTFLCFQCRKDPFR